MSSRQQRALAAICDAFAPGVDGLPSASAMGVPEAVADAVAKNPRESERKQFQQLMSLWDTRLLTALGGGGLRRFSSLSPEQREQVLLSWCDSGVTQRRAAFQALRKGALLTYYMLPGENGRNPVWDAIGYPGPLGKVSDAPAPELHPARPSEDMDLECDVCVVGSGAGGGTAAGVLAAAGLDVVVLEAGEYYSARDFDGGEFDGFARMYMNGGASATDDQSLGLLAGATVGGGTVVNYSTSFRTPDDVREEWAGLGAQAFAGDEYTASLDAVCTRLGVNHEHSTASPRDEVMLRGLEQLGWHWDRMPRNVRGCDQGARCGQCGMGCPLGAKQSTAVTWLVDAQKAGARIVTATAAERVRVDAGEVRGVEARSADGYRVTVSARAVVAACGAIHTPALLKRSGLANRNIGKHLRLHPVSVVFGIFDEEIRPWYGTMQALYSDEHRHLDGGYGLKYETAALNPSLIVAFAPWRSARAHAELLEALPNTFGIGALVRDRDSGEVRVGRDGQPVVKYALSEYDRGHMRRGIEGAAEILEAGGARRIYSSHSRWVSYDPGSNGGREDFMRAADAAGWDAGRLNMGSFHIMGSARMGGDAGMSACNPEGETWDVRNLVVCDASCFPSASGVNPMISIEATAHMNASRLAARL
ncbi:MAG TPA: GMC family oxidoreductase N-terminal domain-containing protein [Thermoleophilaceae bacterium]|nr:GMC family oxidoreductase N-terminal domain-containing protein [Thermoleophilaceae bacterium]